MGETALHRVFIGGLYNEVTEEDVRGRFLSFGEVSDVTIVHKKDGEGCVTKTFGYVNLKTTTSKLNKCFAVYGGTMWKGSQLKVQLAKENFISKLERERAEPPPPVLSKKKQRRCAAPAKTYSDIMDTASSMKKIVPGVPVEGEKNWVIGKYGRPLPVVYIPKVSGRKTTKVDPSKFCHCLRKIGDVEVEDKGIGNLSWSYDDEEIIPRKKKKKKKRNENDDDDVTAEKTITDCPDEKPDGDVDVISKPKKKKKNRVDESKENVPCDTGEAENTNIDNCENSLNAEPTTEHSETAKPCKKKKRKHMVDETTEIEESPTPAIVGTNSTDKKRKKVKEKSGTLTNDLDAPPVDNLGSPTSTTLQLSTDETAPMVLSATPDDNDYTCNGESNNIIDSPKPSPKLGTSIIEQLAAKKRCSDSQLMPVIEINKNVVSSTDNNEDGDSDDDGGTFNMFDFELESLGGSTNSTFLSTLLMNHVEVRDEGNSPGNHRDSDSNSDADSDLDSDNDGVNDSNVKGTDDNVSSCSSDNVEPVGTTDTELNVMEETVEAVSTGSNVDKTVAIDNSETTPNMKEKKSKKSKNAEVRNEDQVTSPDVAITNKTETSRKNKPVDTPGSIRKSVSKQEKHALSEEQRTKSLLARTNELADQKSAVTKALKDVDKGGSHTNRIVFGSDEEDEVEDEVLQVKSDAMKLWSDDEESGQELKKDDDDDDVVLPKTLETGKQLFDEDSDEDDEEILIKPQFQGKEGEKLFKMQQRFGGDERFKLDERFAEEESEAEVVKEEKGADDVDGDHEDGEDLQKEKEMNISVLEQVLGKSLTTEKKNNNFDAPMQRYDPSNIDHEKYEVKAPEKPSKRDQGEEDDEDGLPVKKTSKAAEEQPLPEVSKDTFYSVDNSIQDLFTKGEEQTTFSFFGSQEDDEPEQDKEDVAEETTVEMEVAEVEESMEDVKKPLKEPSWKKGLEAMSKKGDRIEEKVDLQSRGDEEMEVDEDGGKNDRLTYLWIADGDPRLEIAKAFVRTESMDEITNQWKTLRKTFTEDYKKKHKDALRRVRKMREKRFNRR